MRMGKGFLSGAFFCAAAVLCLLRAVPALAAYDPLADSPGIWKGKADNGHETFSITVTLKKVN